MRLTRSTYLSVIISCILALSAFLLLTANTNIQIHVANLITRISTDKQTYHVNESIYFRHELYNPNP